MTVTISGTAGITTPEIISTGGPLVVNASAPDNSVVVDSAGSFGVNTASPTGKLSVAVPDGSTTAFYAERTGGSPAQLSVTFANQYANLLASGAMAFHTNGTQRMLIAADGTITGTAGNLMLVQGTAVSASGTSVNFTGIPSWVKRITVLFSGVSTNGSSNLQVQVGSGSVTTSGYVGGYSRGTTAAAASTGLVVQISPAAASLYVGSIIFTNVTSNTWVGSGNTITNASDAATLSNCSIALGGALDRVRITTINGTDTFDAGSVNILYE